MSEVKSYGLCDHCVHREEMIPEGSYCVMYRIVLDDMFDEVKVCASYAGPEPAES